MINLQIAQGRLGRDPEQRFTQNGTSVTTFSIATDRSWKDQSGEWKKQTDWINVVAFKMDWIAEKLHKGDMVYAQGRSQTRSYEKEGHKVYATELIAETVKLIPTGHREEGGESAWQ